jgi:hypothetical protein
MSCCLQAREINASLFYFCVTFLLSFSSKGKKQCVWGFVCAQREEKGRRKKEREK